MRPGRWETAVLMTVCLVVPPSAASASVVPGTPLNIVTNDAGQIQVRSDGATAGEFTPPTSDAPLAGLNLVVDADTVNAEVVGFLGTEPFTLGNPMPPSGDGSPGNPFVRGATYSASGFLGTVTIVERITYVNGQRELSVRYTMTTNATGGQKVRPSLSGDLFTPGGGDDSGFLLAGPPRFVGGANQSAGASAGIVEVTPWARFESGAVGGLFGRIGSTTGLLTDTVDGTFLDGAAGIQWADHSFPPSAPQPLVVEAILRFPRFDALALSPASASLGTGQTHTVSVSALDENGAPAVGRSIVYSIAGANPGTGTIATSAGGTATISWIGNAAGTDTLTAFADVDGDGARDPNEAQEAVTAEWTSPSPRPRVLDDLDDPEPFREVNVAPVAGEVFVRLPGGAALPSRSDRAGARSSQSGAPTGFIPLREAAQIPMGSQLDTTRGRVLMESAASRTLGRTQRAQFYFGRFTILQRRAARPITDIVLKGGSFRGCSRASKSSASDGPEADASQRRRRGRRVRRVWGDGRGRFRTRGRYSSATVRGTKWVTEDRCNGTLTRVPRRPRTNRVVVRDLVQRRSVRLRAGRSYFAFKR